MDPPRRRRGPDGSICADWATSLGCRPSGPRLLIGPGRFGWPRQPILTPGGPRQRLLFGRSGPIGPQRITDPENPSRISHRGPRRRDRRHDPRHRQTANTSATWTGSQTMSRTSAYDLVVIGAGAAGLWLQSRQPVPPPSGCPAGPRSRNVPSGRGTRPRWVRAPSGSAHGLLDRREKVGAKILMSGGTRCNLTHCEVLPADYRGGNRNRIARVLRAHPASGISARLHRRTRRSDQAGARRKDLSGRRPQPRSATHSLRRSTEPPYRPARASLVRARADFRHRGRRPAAPRPSPTTAVARPWTAGRPRVPRWRILIRDDADRPLAPIETARVLVATGGCSFPQVGQRRLGLRHSARARAHRGRAAPCAFTAPSRQWFPRRAERYRHARAVELRVDGKPSTAEDPLLWTHTGVSGPAALDLSGSWARAHHERPQAEIRSSPASFPRKQWSRRKRGGSPGRSTIRHARSGRTSPRSPIASPRRWCTAGADPVQPLAQTARALRRAVIAHMVRFPLLVEGSSGFRKAEVTSGGVPLEEVDQGLESRILPGVHLAGEVLMSTAGSVDSTSSGLGLRAPWRRRQQWRGCFRQTGRRTRVGPTGRGLEQRFSAR